MATVKVTKVAKFNTIMGMVPQTVSIEGTEVNLHEFLANEVALIQKKSASKSKKNDRTEEKARVLEVLAEGKASPTEVMAKASLKSTQMATAVLKALAEEGAVVKKTEGKKVFYTLA